MKKIFVLDTSVCLANANAVYSFGKDDVYIPLKVLEEVDKHKNRQDGVGQNARNFIKILDELRERGSLQEGVRLQKGKGFLKSVPFTASSFPSTDLDLSVPDHVIIATAYGVSKTHLDKKIVVVSRDINMRVICDSIGLGSQDYDANQVISSSSELYSGVKDVVIDDEFIDRLYRGEQLFLDDKVVNSLFPNQFLTLISNNSPNKTALARFINKDTPLRKIAEFRGRNSVYGIESRNREQTFAMDLLMDPTVPVVTLVGKAGSGKTLNAIAAGLEQMLTKGQYTRMIVSRPVQPLGRDIGYLPGTMEEKMLPWLSPIQDNLQFLLGNDKELLQEYMMKGQIEIEALTYIRGRSIAKAFMVIDEAQNLSAHELKTIVTRVGEDTKIVLTGDIEQIDNVYVNDTSNGLAYAVEKFKSAQLAGHVTLTKGERSAVATLASKIL
jgi:PhoH-like ATPase